ncbi:hypothetical protein [Actinacidiphila glaucinigra]|uniref:hypothetical protein n=1 Tax=Actinacidiphila glaucinigra TaxID=235986 RepID=UPI003716B4C0
MQWTSALVAGRGADVRFGRQGSDQVEGVFGLDAVGEHALPPALVRLAEEKVVLEPPERCLFPFVELHPQFRPPHPAVTQHVLLRLGLAATRRHGHLEQLALDGDLVSGASLFAWIALEATA